MGQLKASAGTVDLGPPTSGWMTGYAARVETSTGTHDPLMARAVMLDDGKSRLAVVSCDVVGFAPEVVDRMRRRIEEKSGTPGGHVMVCCTHTHSGPATMPLRGQMGYVHKAWLRTMQTRIVHLVSGLVKKLEPARVADGKTIVSGIGFNRQDRSRPVDEELTAIAIERRDGSSIATLIDYPTHAVVLGPQNLLYSGDFPGATARQLDWLTGGVGVYLQGACGDVDPVTQIEKGWGQGTFEDCEAIGERLATAAVDALKPASRATDVTLGAASRTVDVPLDPPPSAEELEKLVAQFKSDRRAAIAAPVRNRSGELTAKTMLAWTRKLRHYMKQDGAPTSINAEVFAARINEIRIVGLPFETYTDIGLGIKEGLKPLKGVVVGYANGLYGYCPTGWAKDQGGYGADASCRWFGALVTAIGRGADELLIEAGVDLARTL